MMNLFAYGTLRFPEVWRALLGREHDFEDIQLSGFRRGGLIGKVYPGLVRNIDSIVDGRLYFQVDEKSIKILDCFEDEFYEREIVEIPSAKHGVVQARIYLLPESLSYLLTKEEWDVDRFSASHLKQFIEMCSRFVSDLAVHD